MTSSPCRLCLADQRRLIGWPVRRWVGISDSSIRTTLPPARAIFAGARSSLGPARPAGRSQPPVHGGAREAVAAGEVGKPLVMPQRGRHDHRDPPGRTLAPSRADLLRLGGQQPGQGGEGLRGQLQPTLVGKLTVVPGRGEFCRHTSSTRAGGRSVTGPWREIYARMVKVPFGSLCRRPRTASFDSLPRGGSSRPGTTTSMPSSAPTSLTITGPPAACTICSIRR